MKNCSNKNCKQSNPQAFSNFYKNSKSSDGYINNCITCSKIYKKEFRSSPEQRAKNAAYMQEYKKRPGVKELLQDIKQKYKENPESNRTMKNCKLQKKFGISIEEYEKMLIDQNHVCAICFNPEVSKHQNGKIKQLAVDHCHKTGKVRGLLCNNCNRGIGHLKEDLEIFNNAIQYVKKAS